MRSRDSFARAAARHIRDAQHLAAAGGHQSLEQAWHLAGFGPECARKAGLSDRLWDQVLGHELGAPSDWVLGWLSGLDPASLRYAAKGLEYSHPMLQRWSPADRYNKDDAHRSPEVRELVEQATELVAHLLAALWADGVVKLGGL